MNCPGLAMSQSGAWFGNLQPDAPPELSGFGSRRSAPHLLPPLRAQRAVVRAALRGRSRKLARNAKCEMPSDGGQASRPPSRAPAVSHRGDARYQAAERRRAFLDRRCHLLRTLRWGAMIHAWGSSSRCRVGWQGTRRSLGRFAARSCRSPLLVSAKNEGH
jgi:hypothetical protein